MGFVFISNTMIPGHQTMTSEVESCGPESSYAYAQFKMDSTLVTEFDMVCNKSREVVRSVIE